MKLSPPLAGAAILALGCTAALCAAAPSSKYAPLPYNPLGTYGQALVDVEIARHPELKILTVHVTPPGVPPDQKGNRRLMFSNIGRIGKIDNEEDDTIFTGGKEVTEVTDKPAPPSTNFSITAAPKYEVISPLLDKSGKKIGLIVMVFPYHEHFDLEIYHQVAKTVEAELNGKVDTKEELLAPAP